MTRRWGTALTVVLLAATGACAAADARVADHVETPGCAHPSPGERVVVPDATMWNTTDDVNDMIRRITSVGTGEFSSSFSGLSVDAEHGITTVYRVPDAEFDTFVRETAGPQCFYIIDAKYSKATLQPWKDKISRDLVYWTNLGLPLNSVGVSNDGSGVLIGTRDVAVTEKAFRERYGADAPILFEKSEPLTMN